MSVTRDTFQEARAGRAPYDRARSLGPVAAGLARLLVALCVTSSGAAGCYRPSVKEGGLACAPKGPLCPEGFSCHGDRCYAHDPGDAAPDRTVSGDGSRTDAGAGDADAGSDQSRDTDAAMCVQRQALTGCTPGAVLPCDPVCQTGCCTTEKCTALNSGPSGGGAASLGCSAQPSIRSLGETCDVINAGTTSRSDNCLPGLLCVTGDTDSVCLQLCRGDADCTGGAKCETRRIEPASSYSASVCGLPNTPCNPTETTNRSAAGCPGLRTCYLISTNAQAGDRTVCDITSGSGGNQASCQFAFDCFPGWTCPATGTGAGRCQVVCAHNATSSTTCPRGLACQNTGKAYDLCL